MGNFVDEYYFPVVYSLEVIAVVVGFIQFNKYKNSPTKYFIGFLAYILIMDLLVRYPEALSDAQLKSVEGTVFYGTYWIYNFFWLIGNPLFFVFYSYKMTQLPWLKKGLLYLGVLFFVITMSYSFVNWGELVTSPFPFVELFGFLIVLLTAFSYYIELLQIDNRLYFYQSVRFYALTANLIWWFMVTPILFFDLYYSKADSLFQSLRWEIYFLGNVIMLPMYIVGLIVSKKDEHVDEIYIEEKNKL